MEEATGTGASAPGTFAGPTPSPQRSRRRRFGAGSPDIGGVVFGGWAQTLVRLARASRGCE
jgi:hypothetical protein